MCLQPPADMAEHVVFSRSGRESESHWGGREESWRFSACDDGESRVRRCHSVLEKGEGLWMLNMEDMKLLFIFFFFAIMLWECQCNIVSSIQLL